MGGIERRCPLRLSIRLLVLSLMVCAFACEPAEDPAALDGGSTDPIADEDGGRDDAEPDGAPQADAAPRADSTADAAPVDGGPLDPPDGGEADAGPDPDPDLGPDAAPPAVCGDGEIQGDELCDDGPANSDDAPDACRTDCRPARCGDGVVDSDELCDGDRTCDPATCAPACEDACEPETRGCDGGVVVCGDHDADPCFEWSAPVPCADDEACVEGACVCVDTCPEDAVECVGEGARRACRPQADGCLGWDAPEDCGAFEACSEGTCAPLPLPPVLINEVLYDAAGADRAGVFIELWGPPGTALAGLQVQGINGNGGAVVDEIALDGAIADDGFYLLAHPEAAPELQALADQVDVDVDLQNGPDSVRLVRGEEVIDALGYGEFGDDIFAGEGRPAPDVSERSLSRDAAHSDSDDNLADFRPSEPSPRGDPPPPCVDDCAADALRCLDTVAEACRPGVDGCLIWQPQADCAAEGLACVDGACARACQDACDPRDAPRCIDDAVTICRPDADGCLDWLPEVSCADDGLRCREGACVCPDACPLNAARCVGDVIERCAAVGDCVDWIAEANCADDGGRCLDGICRPPPRCGDGQVDPGEACDDGNFDLGDGCDDTCAEEDPFDERAALMVLAPPPGVRPDHVPDDLGATTYAPGLQYDNAHYFVYEAFDDSIREQVARVPLGRGLRLPPGDYAVVINDSFTRIVVDWNDRVELAVGRIEVRSPERGTYTVRPPRRFDDIATPLPLRGCGPFGNQARSPWIFGGCDGELGGGAIDLDTGIVLLPLTYRVGVDAQFHSPNVAFVEVRPGEVTAYAPADTRARVQLLPDGGGDLPDWQLERMPTYGTSDRRVPSGNEQCHVFRFIDLVEGFEYIGSGCAERPLVVPAGRYYVTVNDTYVVRDVAAGETLELTTGRIEVPGAGTFDIEPDPDVRRFTFIDNPVECSRDGPETYLLAHCFLEEPDGIFPRGTGVRVLPGSYRVHIYNEAGALLQSQDVQVPDGPR